MRQFFKKSLKRLNYDLKVVMKMCLQSLKVINKMCC